MFKRHGSPVSSASTDWRSRLASLLHQPSPRRARWRVALVVIMVGIGGAAWLVLRPASRPRSGGPIETVQARRMDLGASTDAGGVVNAIQRVNLSPNVASRIERLLIREGDRVQGGQLVAEMESEELQVKLRKVQAQLAGAQAQLQAAEADARAAAARRLRYERLLASGAISFEVIEELRNVERQAVFRVQQARQRIEEVRYEVQQNRVVLRNTRVYAPFPGVITRLYAQKGQFVAPTTAASEEAGATSTSIAELSSGLEVVAKIPQASLTEISIGQKAEVRTDAFPNDVFRGVVTMVSPRAVTEAEVNAFPVTVRIETGLGRLKPAMNAQVRFLANPIRNAVAIPLAALTSGDNDSRGAIRVRPDGVLEFVPVKAGRISGDVVQVVSGLRAGDRVLISAPPAGVKIPGYKPPS